MNSVTPSKLTIATELSDIVGAAGVIPFANLTEPQQRRIRSALSPAPRPPVVFPRTQGELAAVVACAHRHGWRMLIMGQGSKLSWGEVATEIDLVLSTQQINQIVDHDTKDLTVTLEPGVSLAALQDRLAPHQQFFALDPAYAEHATLGGIIATQDAGAWRHRYGGVRDMLLGLTFVRSDGEMAHAGGRVVKNVAGYDLMKLFTGSYGTLGVIAQVTLRLYPSPESSATVLLTGPAAAIASATQTLVRGAITPTALDLLSSQLVTAWGLSGELGLAVRLQSLSESVGAQGDRLSELAQSFHLTATHFTDTEDAQFWSQLQQQLWLPPAPNATVVVCKFGVLTATAVETMMTLAQLPSAPMTVSSRIHAGSGLGVLRLVGEVSPILIGELRSLCQRNQGFLTVLEAPRSLKQQIEIWGYTGNALPSMRQLKDRFDDQRLLNPGRFVGRI